MGFDNRAADREAHAHAVGLRRVEGCLSNARQVYRHFDRLTRGFVLPEADDVRNGSATNLAGHGTMALAGRGFGGGDAFGNRRV